MGACVPPVFNESNIPISVMRAFLAGHNTRLFKLMPSGEKTESYIHRLELSFQRIFGKCSHVSCNHRQFFPASFITKRRKRRDSTIIGGASF
eukprot:TRINITY_DN8366_c0_g1_i1.p2 TRINITY_DN8366_c0_g1~~TRINITY_DN8366_c0_g1_i1.p2  ORF type:complete len:92 (-),score=5.52 TRINITY_DN8366_c0_g1_i1:441-716(-)